MLFWVWLYKLLSHQVSGQHLPICIITHTNSSVPRVGIAKRYLVLYRFAKNNFNKTVFFTAFKQVSNTTQTRWFGFLNILLVTRWSLPLIVGVYFLFLLFGNVCVRLKNVSVLVDVSCQVLSKTVETHLKLPTAPRTWSQYSIHVYVIIESRDCVRYTCIMKSRS